MGHPTAQGRPLAPEEEPGFAPGSIKSWALPGLGSPVTGRVRRILYLACEGNPWCHVEKQRWLELSARPMNHYQRQQDHWEVQG